MKRSVVLYSLSVLMAMLISAAVSVDAADKPNILVIWGDDIGATTSAPTTIGIMGYSTPNIDGLRRKARCSPTPMRSKAARRAGPRSSWASTRSAPACSPSACPARRTAFPTGRPTIADLLKNQGYATGQFGKNHLGDRDKHLPTVHGFDEFFGNLYHLNAEEEPETYYYPKDPEFRKKYGPRGVLHCGGRRQGRAERSRTPGRSRVERMPTIDQEIYDHANEFIDTAAKEKKPFFVWFNSDAHARLDPSQESVGGTDRHRALPRRHGGARRHGRASC